MPGLGLVLGVVVVLGLLGGKKKKTTTKPLLEEELPDGGCGLYPWIPDEVDAAASVLIYDEDMRDVDEISIEVARDVYPFQPEGQNQIWPAQKRDSRAHCIYDRIRIRVNLILAEVLDEEAGGDEDCPEGEQYDADTDSCVPVGPPLDIVPAQDDDDGLELDVMPAQTDEDRGPGEALLCPPGTRPDPSTGECYPDYPEPGPVDVRQFEHPENYPMPGTFHQIGGPHSEDDLGHIARKALAQFGMIVSGDQQWALDQANKAKLWKAYRVLINCVPTNHAYFASRNAPGTKFYYPTPSDVHINMFPRHDDVRAAMIEGRVPERYAHPDNPIADGRPGNPRHHAWPWLPPLDPEAYLNGEVVVLREYWETGDWKLMPPPEFLTWAINHGIPGLPADLAWTTLGCEDYWEWEAA